MLGVNSSPVTRRADKLAASMASLVRRKLGASIGIGIEGYSELVDGVTMGEIFIAIDSEGAEMSMVQNYSGRDYQIRKRAAQYALFDLMKWLNST
jgi:nicotinamide mononucleotide (NMN) deamidase PncC